MKYYEFNLLINPDFSQEEAEKFSDSLIADVAQKGNVLPGKILHLRKLAYAVKGQKEAWLLSFGFVFKNDEEKEKTFGEIDQDLKTKTELLRYLVIKREEQDAQPTPPPLEEKKDMIKKKKKEEKKESKEVDVKQVEEKLEEILEE